MNARLHLAACLALAALLPLTVAAQNTLDSDRARRAEMMRQMEALEKPAPPPPPVQEKPAAIEEKGRSTTGKSVDLKSGGNSSSRAVPGIYSSVCIRNREKIRARMDASKMPVYGSTSDGFVMRYKKLDADVLRPCAAQDSRAARELSGIEESIRRDEELCRTITSVRCGVSEWGSSGTNDKGQRTDELNKAWFEMFNREAQAALTDPGYSADLGRVGGSASPPAGKSCQPQMAALDREFAEVLRRPLPPGTTPALRRIMWMNQKQINLLKSACPDNAETRQLIQEHQKSYAEAETSCASASSSGRCAGPNPY